MNDEVKFDFIPETNKEYISVTCGSIRFIDSYRSLSTSLDELVKTLADDRHKTVENLKKEIVDNDEKLNFVNEKGEENKTIENMKKDYPDEIQKIRRSFDYIYRWTWFENFKNRTSCY